MDSPCLISNTYFRLPASVTILLLILIAALQGCTENGKTLPSSTEKAGEIIVVLQKEYWNGAVGMAIRKILFAEHEALPQPEPIFDLVNIPDSYFTGLFKTHRNILAVKITAGLKPSVSYSKNVWASPQLFIKITAPDISEAEDLITKQKDQIVQGFLKAERARLVNDFNSIKSEGISTLLINKFKLNLIVPRDYKIAKQEKEFVWIRKETPEISLGILIYRYNSATLSGILDDYILSAGDSVTKLYVPGPSEGSYMTAMHDFPTVKKKFNHHQTLIIETRGLWMVQGNFMGGPFISLTFTDKDKKHISCIKGYVYAPKFNKRDYLRQLEAILYSLKILD